MAKKTERPLNDEEINDDDFNEEVDGDEVDDAETSPGEEVVIKLPPNCRVNEPIIYQLDILLDFVHPRRLKKDLIEVLLLYLSHDCENLSGSFKETAENYLLLFQWLDTVEKEMDERGFE